MRLIFALSLAALVFGATASLAAEADPNQWLEQVESPKALDWVRAEDARTFGVLKADPHYQQIFDQSLAVAEAADRIPMPQFLGGEIYNLWQDADHVQGIWRHTSLAQFRTATPAWTTLIDLDALSKSEGKHWVWKHVTCWHPEDRRCLISLSDGGEDAVLTREFDLASGKFLADGFTVPHAKQSAVWESADSVIVGTDWGPGTMTASGYPFVVKRLKRGQQIGQAAEIFRGTPKDVAVELVPLHDGQNHHAVILQEGLDFFRSTFFLVHGDGTTKLKLPEKAEIEGLLNDQLVVKADEDFTPAAGTAIKAGSLFALDLEHLDAAPILIFAPGPRQSVEEATVTQNRLVAVIEDNVRGRAMVFTPGVGSWTANLLSLPDNAAIGIAAASDRDDQMFLTVEGFLDQTTLYLANAAASGQAPAVVKSLPAKFDASKDTVDQSEVASKDGTKIPYFVVHPKNMKLDGSNPTLLYAYGGFQVSMLPTYSPWLGKLWLEPGGVYVLANIRGGGEFGPAWHEAGVKTHRQRIYDDFAAVAADLIQRKITSPERLGIRGGSNGGLLMGVEFEQHPDLWHAVIIDVPLLDMLRFEKIAAGASWVGEYGSVANPDERKFLAGISPYNNLKKGVAYPEPFIFTTTKDDRVGPVHARKFAAKMKAMGLPYLYDETIEGGHAAGANLRQTAEERALEITYLREKLMP
jgi:prolyl oligopeptidase